MRIGATPSSDALQNKAQAKYAIGLGLFVLVVSALVFILYFHQSSEISAYQSASNCASPGDALQGQGCHFQGEARVLSTSRHDRLESTVEFNSLPARTFSTSFPNHNEPSSTALKAGTTTDGELWATKVTRLAGTMTVDNPESTVQPYGQIAVGLLVSGLVILGLSAGLARAAWRER